VSWDYGMLSSEIYELDKPIGRSFGDVEYYTRSLSGVNGRILEPAAGTGRILIPLLEAGHDVEGFDISPDMLAICRQHCRERGLEPDLHDADIRSARRGPAARRGPSIPSARDPARAARIGSVPGDEEPCREAVSVTWARTS
jgi:SAM-dependent methyltransferase